MCAVISFLLELKISGVCLSEWIAFLSRATDASTGESREVRRKGLPIVNVPDALLLNRTVFQDNGDCHVMRSAAFIAKGNGTVLN